MTAETRLTHLGLVETAKGIASGAFSSEEVARACIQRIEAAQPHLDLGVFRDLSSKTIVLGIVDLSTNEIESVATLAERIRRALPFIAAERLIAAPDCGMKYLTRASAFGKLSAMVSAAEVVRAEVS